MWQALNHVHCVVNSTSRNGNNIANIIFYCLPAILYVWHAIKYEICSFAALLRRVSMVNEKPAQCDYQPSHNAAPRARLLNSPAETNPFLHVRQLDTCARYSTRAQSVTV